MRRIVGKGSFLKNLSRFSKNLPLALASVRWQVLRKSVSGKLIGALSLTMVLILGGSTLLSYFITKDMMIDNAETALRTLSDSSATRLAFWLESRKTEVNMLASSPLILEGAKGKIIPYFTNEINKMGGQGGYEYFLIASANGDFYSSNGKIGNAAQMEFFLKATQGLKTIVSTPFADKETDKWVIAVASPMLGKDGMTIKGVVAGIIDLDVFIKMVKSIRYGKTGNGFVIDGAGTVITNVQQKGLKMTQGNASLQEISERMTTGQKGVSRYQSSGKHRYIGFAPLGDTGWSLGITVPAEEVMAQVATLNIVHTLSPIAAILIMAVMTTILIKRVVTIPLTQLKTLMSRAGSGDLTVKIGEQISSRDDEISSLALSFEQMVDEQRQIVSIVHKAIAELAASTQDMAACTEELATSAEGIDGSMSSLTLDTETARCKMLDVSQVLVQLSSQIQISRELSRSAVENSRQTWDTAQTGYAAVEETVQQMDSIRTETMEIEHQIRELRKYSDQIDLITNMITDIARQTNLLALNAAIEAARAGAAGRGFAVVADEIRKLAEQSTRQAAEVLTIVRKISSGVAVVDQRMHSCLENVDQGVTAVQSAGNSLKNVITVVSNTVKDIENIANVTSEQVAASDKVVELIDVVATGVENPVEKANYVATSSRQIMQAIDNVATTTSQINEMSNDIGIMTAKFKVS